MTVAQAFYHIRNESGTPFYEEAVKVLVDFFKKYDGFCILFGRLYVVDNPIKLIDKTGLLMFCGWIEHSE